MENEPKTWTPIQIINYVTSNVEAVRKALIILYKLQTADEREIERSRVRNGIGFNKPDSKMLTSIAKWTIKTGFLTEKQIFVVRKRILKYANQLTSYSNKGYVYSIVGPVK